MQADIAFAELRRYEGVGGYLRRALAPEAYQAARVRLERSAETLEVAERELSRAAMARLLDQADRGGDFER